MSLSQRGCPPAVLDLRHRLMAQCRRSDPEGLVPWESRAGRGISGGLSRRGGCVSVLCRCVLGTSLGPALRDRRGFASPLPAWAGHRGTRSQIRTRPVSPGLGAGRSPSARPALSPAVVVAFDAHVQHPVHPPCRDGGVLAKDSELIEGQSPWAATAVVTGGQPGSGGLASGRPSRVTARRRRRRGWRPGRCRAGRR